jgi:tRNA(fMet)-specific endonuclease VapC
VYLLDTNHCSFILIQKDLTCIQKLNSLPKGTEIFINAIIYGELILMAEKSDKKEENLVIFNSFTQSLTKIYPIDEETSKIYGQFHAEIINKFAPKEKEKRRKFKIKDAGIHPNDLWIACTAIQYDLTIISEDSDFKQISKVRPLKLECWKSQIVSEVKTEII